MGTNDRGIRAAARSISMSVVVAVTVAMLAPPTPAIATRPDTGLHIADRIGKGESLTYRRLADPARTVVSDRRGVWIATFTNNSRTVTLAGPSRRFAEAGSPAAVTTKTWVRLLPQPFPGTVDQQWLAAARLDSTPDVLAIAFQYVSGAAPSIVDGLQIAGDAHYGPIGADGTRVEGSDFNDYLGLGWSYGGTVDAAEPDQLVSLDCSGFVRMVFGYRSGVPLSNAADGTGLPRRSFEILQTAPGVVTIPDSGSRPGLDKLAPGDLLFFDAATDDGTRIDHVAIYLGLDEAGQRRFVSSRKSIDGPTLSDYRGASILDGEGLYARSFRAARRL